MPRSLYAKDGPRGAAILADLMAIYRKHGLSLGHEDIQGGFVVEELSDHNIEWLQWASLELKRQKSKKPKA
jgi:hypothetical protein